MEFCHSHTVEARRPLAPVDIAVAVLVVLAAGCTGSNSAPSTTAKPAPPTTTSRPPPLITLDQARQFIDKDRAVNQQANAALDTALQDSHEVDAARALDDYQYAALRARGEKFEGAAKYNAHTPVVPYQMSYPAQFLDFAEGTSSSGDAFKDIGLYIQASESDSPKLAAYTYPLTDTPFPATALDSSGYAQLVTDSSTVKFDVDSLAAAHAAYLNGNVAADQPGTSDTFDSEAIQMRAKEYQEEVADLKSKDINVAFTFDAGPYQSTAYRMGDGGALVFYTVHLQHILTSALPGGTVDYDEPIATLAPGSYRQVVYDGLIVVTAIDPPGAATVPVKFVASVAGVTKVTGT